MRSFVLLALTLAGLLTPPAAPSLSAAQVASPTGPGSVSGLPGRHRVFLLTIDQGGEIWELFGHNAILIQDSVTGQSLAWNWGLFDFAAVDFVPRFLTGTMLYTMGPADLDAFLASYRSVNRSVYANEILLTPAEALELDRLVRLNFEPENRDYVYDYYRDNCSTRARDVLDQVLGGSLRDRFGAAATPHSYRWHTRRLVQETGWLDQSLTLLLGPMSDRRITEWESMFLPMEMMRLLEGYERPGGASGLGPLLGPREVLVEADRPPEPTEAPPFSWFWPVLGIGSAVLLWRLGTAAGRGGRVGRVGLAGGVGLWGLFAGGLGLLMVGIWFTHHEFGHWNVNILHYSPLSIALFALTPLAAVKEGWWYGQLGRIASSTAVVVAASSVLACLLQLTPLADQDNAEALVVGVPINLAVAMALVRATRPRSPSS